MKKTFALRHLTFAVIGTMTSAVAVANTAEPSVELGHEVINIDRQGTKIKTNVVTLQEKDESTATDLRGLLSGEPSINFSGGNAASQFITIRGMGQNSIDVKVDNAYSDSQVFYHQGRFTLDPALVKVVSVQKGAGSASAGIGQTNGAIVAKTVDAQDLLKNSDKDWGVKVHAGYSSNDEHSYGVTAYGQADNFDFLVATNRVERDDYKGGNGYKGIYNNDVVPFSSSDKVSHLYKMGYNLGDHRFVLSHFKDLDKGTRSIREEFDVYDPVVHGLNCVVRNAPVQCRLRKEFVNNGQLQGQLPEYRELSLTQTNLEWTGKDLGFVSEATANAYVMKNERDSSGDNNSYQRLAKRNVASIVTKGFNLNLDSYLTDSTLVKYGVNYRHQEVEPNQTPSAKFVQNTEKADKGVYAEVIHDIGQFTLTGGLRYDHFDYTDVTGKKASDGHLSPSVGVIYQATPELSFNATHNHATRSPRLADAILTGNRGYTVAEGVKAERAKNTEVGFNYNHANFFVNGGYFWQKIDDLTNSRGVHDGITGATLDPYHIDNVGYAKNKGWELDAGYKFQNLTARIGVADSKPQYYTYAGKVQANKNPIEFTNREFGQKLGRIWTAGLSYRFDNPSLEVGINHRRADKVTGIAWQSGAPNNTVKDGYNTTDVYANWKPYGNDRMNVNFAVNNIGDKLYRPQHSQGLPATGREFRVGVNFTY